MAPVLKRLTISLAGSTSSQRRLPAASRIEVDADRAATTARPCTWCTAWLYSLEELVDCPRGTARCSRWMTRGVDEVLLAVKRTPGGDAARWEAARERASCAWARAPARSARRSSRCRSSSVEAANAAWTVAVKCRLTRDSSDRPTDLEHLGGYDSPAWSKCPSWT